MAIMMILGVVWCIILIRLHFMQRDLPNGQEWRVQRVYAQPPHAIVYCPGPGPTMPPPTQPRSDDSERATAPSGAASTAGSHHTSSDQETPMRSPYPAYPPPGAYPYPPPMYCVMPAPMNLTPGPRLF